MEVLFYKKYEEGEFDPIWEPEEGIEYGLSDIHDCILAEDGRERFRTIPRTFVIDVEKDEQVVNDLLIVKGYGTTVDLLDEENNVSYNMTTKDFVNAAIEGRVIDSRVIGPLTIVKRGGSRYALKIV